MKSTKWKFIGLDSNDDQKVESVMGTLFNAFEDHLSEILTVGQFEQLVRDLVGIQK